MNEKEFALNENLRLQEVLKSELKKIQTRLAMIDEERRLLRSELRRRANFKRQGKPTVPRTPGQRIHHYAYKYKISKHLHFFICVAYFIDPLGTEPEPNADILAKRSRTLATKIVTENESSLVVVLLFSMFINQYIVFSTKKSFDSCLVAC